MQTCRSCSLRVSLQTSIQRLVAGALVKYHGNPRQLWMMDRGARSTAPQFPFVGVVPPRVPAPPPSTITHPPTIPLKMTSIVVTGTNSGMGLGFVKELLKYPELTHIFATARDPTSSASAELQKVAEENPGRIHLVALELTETSAAVFPVSPQEGGVGELGLIVGCGGGGEESRGG
jgi:hypothetical protein